VLLLLLLLLLCIGLANTEDTMRNATTSAIPVTLDEGMSAKKEPVTRVQKLSLG
jgi:hypothetical protein